MMDFLKKRYAKGQDWSEEDACKEEVLLEEQVCRVFEELGEDDCL